MLLDTERMHMYFVFNIHATVFPCSLCVLFDLCKYVTRS